MFQKILENNLNDGDWWPSREDQTKDSIILPILRELDWNVSKVDPEHSQNAETEFTLLPTAKRLDLVLLDSRESNASGRKFVALVEFKTPGSIDKNDNDNLESPKEQLLRYYDMLASKNPEDTDIYLGVVTDAKKWRLYYLRDLRPKEERELDYEDPGSAKVMDNCQFEEIRLDNLESKSNSEPGALTPKEAAKNFQRWLERKNVISEAVQNDAKDSISKFLERDKVRLLGPEILEDSIPKIRAGLRDDLREALGREPTEKEVNEVFEPVEQVLSPNKKQRQEHKKFKLVTFGGERLEDGGKDITWPDLMVWVHAQVFKAWKASGNSHQDLKAKDKEEKKRLFTHDEARKLYNLPEKLTKYEIEEEVGQRIEPGKNDRLKRIEGTEYLVKTHHGAPSAVEWLEDFIGLAGGEAEDLCCYISIDPKPENRMVLDRANKNKSFIRYSDSKDRSK